MRNAVGSARAVDRSVFDAGILDDGTALKFGQEFDGGECWKES